MIMPKKDGYQTIREIRSMKKYKNVPIIAITAKAMTEDKEKCLKAGADDYLVKPIYVDQLFACIQKWLYKRNASKN